MAAFNGLKLCDSPEPSLFSERLFPLGLVGAFFFLGLIGVVRHEPWADEVHAWLVGIRSDDLSALVHNCRTYGHPVLWNVLVYLLTHVCANMLCMQVMHLAIATASAYVFVRFAPFSRLDKSLFLFGYFIFFEYALISRAYAIGVLCVWSFCALYETRRKTYLLLALVLCIMASTSVFGAILATAFALTLLADAVFRRWAGDHGWPSAGDTCAAALLFTAGIVLSVSQMVPPPGEGFPAPWRTDLSLLKLAKVLTTVWNSYVPLPDVSTVHFWDRNLFDWAYPSYLPVVGPIQTALSVGLLAVGLVGFARKPVVLFCYVCGTAGILLFMYAKYFGYLRHHGHLFVLLVACVWLARSYVPVELPVKIIESASRRIESTCGILFTALLTIHAGVGVYSYVSDLRHPFAGSQAVAQAIREEGLDGKLNACHPDWLCVTFAYLFDRSLYYPNADREGTFLIYDRNRMHNLDCPELLRRVRVFAHRTDKEVILLSFVRLDCNEGDPDVTLIREFHTDALFSGDSHCFLYRILPGHSNNHAP